LTAVRRVSFLLFPFLFLALPLHPATVGQIRGHVFDPQGATVAGASVTVINIISGAQFETHTDAVGAYRLLHLEVGEYRVAATHPQFRTVRVRAVVLGGQAIEVDLRFPEVADRTESITVTAEPLAIQAEVNVIAKI